MTEKRAFWPPETVAAARSGSPHYLAALVCRGGHPARDDAPTGSIPEDFSPYCGDCPEPVLNRCESCGQRIRGVKVVAQQFGLLRHATVNYQPPAFCDGCGEPFPWIQRKDLIALIRMQLRQADLDSGTRLMLMNDLDSLEQDGSEVNQASVFRNLKKGLPTAYAALLPILQQLATGEVKKRLNLP